MKYYDSIQVLGNIINLTLKCSLTDETSQNFSGNQNIEMVLSLHTISVLYTIQIVLQKLLKVI